MLNWNVRAIVLSLALVILLVEGLFVYRFYANDNSSNTHSEKGTSSARSTTSPGITMPETTSIGPITIEKTTPEKTTPEKPAPKNTAPKGATFVHRSTKGNTSANSTFLDNPLTNDNPNAVLLVTQVSGSKGSDEEYTHEIGVWYYARGGKWAIYNQDHAPMPAGEVFNVIVLKGSGNAIHRATSGNTNGDTTYIDDNLTNDAPNAIVSVTQNWNPGGGPGVYNDHPIAVHYDKGRKQWAISNLDRAPIPKGASFNLAVSGLSIGG